MPPMIQVGTEYLNVREPMSLRDTVAISPFVASMPSPIPGWFSSFALLGATNKLGFFNVRNRAICDLAYNNQETRDNAAFGMRIRKCGVRFYGPALPETQKVAISTPPGNHVWDCFESLPLFASYLPYLCGFVLRVQQDEKLKIPAMMVSSGIGSVCGGFGQRGNLNHSQSTVAGVNQGVAYLDNTWTFPEEIDIPVRALIAAEIVISDYGRNLLQTMTGPNGINIFNDPNTAGYVPSIYDPFANVGAWYGIQVWLSGQRLVPQRGELHA